MPTINRLPKKERNNQRNEHTDERELRKKAYNSAIWRKVRALYIREHPLCEKCLENGIVNAGSAEFPLNVHHIRSPFLNNEINWDLLGDNNNLMTLCQQCHQKIHHKEDQRTAEEIIEELNKMLNGN